MASKKYVLCSSSSPLSSTSSSSSSSSYIIIIINEGIIDNEMPPVQFTQIPYRPHDDEETVVVIVDPPPVHRPALGRPAFGKRPPFGNPPPFGRLPPFGKPSPPFGRPSFERYPQRDHGPEAIKVIVIEEPAYHSQGELPRTDVGLLICTCD